MQEIICTLICLAFVFGRPKIPFFVGICPPKQGFSISLGLSLYLGQAHFINVFFHSVPPAVLGSFCCDACPPGCSSLHPFHSSLSIQEIDEVCIFSVCLCILQNIFNINIYNKSHKSGQNECVRSK